MEARVALVLTALALLFLSARTVATESDTAVSVSSEQLLASELSVGGVSIDATEARVVERLGEPSRRVETGDGTELHYPGLVVTVGWFESQAQERQRGVFALHGTGRKACTPRGLCPGMAASAATRLYGPMKPFQRSYGAFLEYQPADTSCWLQVSAPGRVIESVGVACQP